MFVIQKHGTIIEGIYEIMLAINAKLTYWKTKYFILKIYLRNITLFYMKICSIEFLWK